MSDFIKSFEKKNRPQFQKYKKYFEETDWSVPVVTKNEEGRIIFHKYYTVKDVKFGDTTFEGKEGEYRVQQKIAETILNRLKHFSLNTTAEDRDGKKASSLIKEMLKIINTHIKRIDDIMQYSSFVSGEGIEGDDKKTEKDYKSDEIAFDNLIYKDQTSLIEGTDKINLETKKSEDTSDIVFLDGVKAPLSMHHVLVDLYPEIKRKVESMKIDFETAPKNEMLIHIENPPTWDEDKHYFEQDKKTLQFYVDEYKKIRRGITIDGVHITPWMYCHLNVFHTPIPLPKKNELTGEMGVEDVIMHPPLRDNEWYIIQDNYYEAKRQGTMMFLCATRRAAKTTLIASHLYHKLLETKRVLVVAGGSAKDLGQIEANFKIAISKAHPAFAAPTISDDWSKEVKIGIKKKNQKDILIGELNVVNLNSGGAKASERLAGFTPDAFVLDECMKSPFLDQLNAAKPAFDSPYGKRLVAILSGCVCAGTKVWTNEGKLVNIEDLNPKDGILGYDVDRKELSKENITYWQPPHEKPCYRIETNQGRYLECSEDHPILTRNQFPCGIYKKSSEFKEAKDVKVGEHITVIKEVDIFGKKRMQDARLVGYLIGDGSYWETGSVKLSTCDIEMLEYVKSKYKYGTDKTADTKDGRVYESIRINGYQNQLRKLGIYGQTKDDKRLPVNIDEYCKKHICEMLGGIFDADGCVYISRGKNRESFVKLTSANIKLIEQVKYLLHKLGIHGNLVFEKPNFNNPKTTRGHYNIIIKDKMSVLAFYRNIFFTVKHKQKNLEDAVKELKNVSGKQVKDKTIRYEKVKSVEYIGVKPVYNLTAGNTHTYIANGIITHNTGSANDDLVKDAIKVLARPEEEGILPINFEALERGVKKEDVTWKRRQFGTFLPGQMSAKEGMVKIEKTLSEYLGIKSTKNIDKVKILVTDWAKGKEIIKADRKKLEGNKKSLKKETVYFPLDMEEIFLSGKTNPFPHEEINKYIKELEETGDVGKKVWLDYDAQGQVQYELSDKEYAEYPYGGGFHDAPVTIYQDPIPDTPYEFCLAGHDDYKQEQADSDSVGSGVIIRRDTKEVVASLHSRPDPHSKLHRQWYMLMQFYNSPAFIENADMDFKTYLDGLGYHVTDKYLLKTITLVGDMTMDGTGRREYGWTPTTKNKSFLLGIAINYSKEPLTSTDEDGNVITRLGFRRCKDIRVLKDMATFRPDGNYDALTAFMSALAYDYYLTVNYGAPILLTQEQKDEKERRFKHRKANKKAVSIFPSSNTRSWRK